jgi:hypothetical protein
MSAEETIKLILVIVLAFALFALWLLPKTRYSQYFILNHSFFLTVNITGVICGILGIILTILFPEHIIELHIWELVLVPYALIHFYWIAAQKSLRQREVFDEKQVYNMTSAAALTWIVSIPFMGFVFILYQSNIVNGLLWFPLYFFQTLSMYSAGSLYFYSKA